MSSPYMFLLVNSDDLSLDDNPDIVNLNEEKQ